jgi:hypothetical protein
MVQRSIDGVLRPNGDNKKLKREIARLRRLTRLYKRVLLILGLIIIVAALLVGGIIIHKHWHKRVPLSPDPVPLSVRKSVGFPVYYPVQNDLPTGYTLDLKSLTSPSNGVLIFTVDYGSNKIIFSEQKKPSSTQIQSFNANYIPLRTGYQTPAGQAEISAYNNGNKNLQTLVSFPTNGSTWIIITAPPNINQNQLEQVLSAITD